MTNGAYRPVSLLLASEAEGGATLADDVKRLISANILDALDCVLAVWRWTPGQAFAVFDIAAQLILLKLLLVLI